MKLQVLAPDPFAFRPMTRIALISSLWELRDENRWLDALNRYWVNPTVCKNRDPDRCVLESLSKIESSPEKQRIGEIRALGEDKERLERE